MRCGLTCRCRTAFPTLRALASDDSFAPMGVGFGCLMGSCLRPRDAWYWSILPLGTQTTMCLLHSEYKRTPGEPHAARGRRRGHPCRAPRPAAAAHVALDPDGRPLEFAPGQPRRRRQGLGSRCPDCAHHNGQQTRVKHCRNHERLMCSIPRSCGYCCVPQRMLVQISPLTLEQRRFLDQHLHSTQR